MLLQIRRPRRPEPLPLRERKGADSAAGDTAVWINVRHKRDRAAPAGQRTSRRTSLASRGPAPAPQK